MGSEGMSDTSFASLGPSLLARKGGARPAMRPQVAPLVADEEAIAALAEEQFEDLGWNDMGHESEAGGGAEVVPINGRVAPDADASGPIVRRQQRRPEDRVLADAAMTGPDDREPDYDEEEDDDLGALYGESHMDEESLGGEQGDDVALYTPVAPETSGERGAEPVPATLRAPKKARVPAIQSGRRAAFTLRLDADRHLKLRLAATVQGVSAQALVTEALDRLLAEFDELDIIANHLKRH